MVRRWWLTMVVMDDGNMHQVDRHAAAGINAIVLKEVNRMPDSATGKLDQQHNTSVLEWQSLLLVGIVRLLWTGSPLQMEPAARYHIQYSSLSLFMCSASKSLSPLEEPSQLMQAFFILRYKNQAKGAPSKQPPDSDDQSLERGTSLFLARLGRQGYDRTH